MTDIDLHQAKSNPRTNADDDPASSSNGHAPTDGTGAQVSARDEEYAPRTDGELAEAHLEALQEILIGQYRRRATDLETELHAVKTELAKLERTVNDKQALIDTMTPVVADSIRKSIADSKDSMIEALYPIMSNSISKSINESKDSMIEALYPIVGRLVTRAVSESMRDLTRKIDEQMRNALTLRVVTRRMRARAMGISEAELMMREALPFQVQEVFLIHRETGILLHHVSTTPEDNADSDVVSGMLTAVSDFVDDAFGQGQEGDLDQIQYGETIILLEEARSTYLAVVTQGFSPPGFQADMRQQIYRIEERFGPSLRDFDGDASRFEGTDPFLKILFRRAAVRADEQMIIPPERYPFSVNALIAVSLVTIALGLSGWRLWEMLVASGFLQG